MGYPNASLDLDIKGIMLQNEKILRSIEQLYVMQQEKDDQQTEDLPTWINLEQAAKMKGAGSLATYKCNQFLQPACGTHSTRILGRKSWRKEVVLEWLQIEDCQLAEYAKKWGAQVPEKYLRRAKKTEEGAA